MKYIKTYESLLDLFKKKNKLDLPEYAENFYGKEITLKGIVYKSGDYVKRRSDNKIGLIDRINKNKKLFSIDFGEDWWFVAQYKIGDIYIDEECEMMNDTKKYNL